MKIFQRCAKSRLMNLTPLILSTLLVSCASSGAGVGRILERPSDFPEEVLYLSDETERGKMWCLTDADYIRETKHIVKLNHVIDKYECQIDILNGEKCQK